MGTTSKIFPLALAKGTEKLCEVCQRRAYLQCTECGVTFYCETEHQQADWVGIHERICQLLVPIRTSMPGSCWWNSDVERHLKKVRLNRVELIEICRLVAESKLSEGKHQEALPAAQFYLRCSMDVHGPNTTQLVPAYLLLADANMPLGNVTLVKEFLAQAEWIVFRNPDCSHAIHHRLHRSLGRLNVLTGNLDAALMNFANDVYIACEEYGLDSIILSDGYFLMAGVFAKQGKMPITRSLYSEVARTWHSHLTKLVEAQIQNINPRFTRPYKAKCIEVDEMFSTMLEFEQNDSRKDSAQVALVACCLAMVWLLGGDSLKALGFCNTALQASQLIPNHDLTESIRSLLQLAQRLQPEPQPDSH
uniref:MYND-type domain-containing protein n=1 Tax=Mola mola TaxID=94237 RepID=A0A3Q3X8I8_MOLML